MLHTGIEGECRKFADCVPETEVFYSVCWRPRNCLTEASSCVSIDVF